MSKPVENKVSEEQRAELDRRLARATSGKGKEYSWEYVKNVARNTSSSEI